MTADSVRPSPRVEFQDLIPLRELMRDEIIELMEVNNAFADRFNEHESDPKLPLMGAEYNGITVQPFQAFDGYRVLIHLPWRQLVFEIATRGWEPWNYDTLWKFRRRHLRLEDIRGVMAYYDAEDRQHGAIEN